MNRQPPFMKMKIVCGKLWSDGASNNENIKMNEKREGKKKIKREKIQVYAGGRKNVEIIINELNSKLHGLDFDILKRIKSNIH